ncbi:hypothetical protein EJ08DRAFT_53578 [Tothia fuscella]|uniref:Uncharacterized protein n=1 Tax=Tothia fuscella TaxID=1048955 RepID=A0A9P4NF08_9PEZI|nr:hypothetical protein EJ08DRAFT_53578 [Tothia fuscella]
MNPDDKQIETEQHYCRCGKLASTLCNTCFEVPVYDEAAPLPSSYYCSGKCKKAHQTSAWCKELRQRKSLLRSAFSFKETWLGYREYAWDADIQRVGFENGGENSDSKLFLHEGPMSRFQQGNIHTTLPYLTDCKEHKEAMLTKDTCTEAIAFLEPFAQILLKDCCENIEHITVTMKNPAFTTSWVDEIGGVERKVHHHQVLRVTTTGGKRWTIDPTCAQYGITEPLTPWEIYHETHVASPIKYLPFDNAKLLYVAKQHADDEAEANYFLIHAYKFKQVLESAKVFDDFLVPRVMKVGGKVMLQGSDKESGEKFAQFMEEFKKAVVSAVQKMYTERAVKKRNKAFMREMMPLSQERGIRLPPCALAVYISRFFRSASQRH